MCQSTGAVIAYQSTTMSAVAALMAKKRQKQEEAKLKAAGKKDPKTTADDADALSKKMDALRIADAEKAKEEPRSKNDSGAQWERQFRHEQETMEELGLRIRKVEGDGACLFRAFGEVFEGDEERHDSVRKKCVEFMKDHEADFAPFVEVRVFSSGYAVDTVAICSPVSIEEDK